ncbi:unnamed protein product [Colias eurytheme]|nr:unnamed protein product [Colias eurytheme]
MKMFFPQQFPFETFVPKLQFLSIVLPKELPRLVKIERLRRKFLAANIKQIWCATPCLRCVKIYFASIRTLVQACLAVTVAPLMDAVGNACRHIRVNMRNDAPEEKDLLII